MDSLTGLKRSPYREDPSMDDADIYIDAEKQENTSVVEYIQTTDSCISDFSSIPPPPPPGPPPKTRSYFASLGSLLTPSQVCKEQSDVSVSSTATPKTAAALAEAEAVKEEHEDEEKAADPVVLAPPEAETEPAAESDAGARSTIPAVQTIPTIESLGSADPDDMEDTDVENTIATKDANSSSDDDDGSTVINTEGGGESGGEENEIEVTTPPGKWSHLDQEEKQIVKSIEKKRRIRGLKRMIVIFVLLAIIAVFLGLGLKRKNEAEKQNESNAEQSASAGGGDDDGDKGTDFDFDNVEPPSPEEDGETEEIITDGEEDGDETSDGEGETSNPPPPTPFPTTTNSDQVTPEPTPSPTNAPNVTTPAPVTNTSAPVTVPTEAPVLSCTDSIFSDQSCYELGDVIQISFLNCEPRVDDWVGIYPLDPNRPLDDIGEQIDWFWTCGTKTWPETCDQTVNTAVLPFNVDVDLVEGFYVAYMVRSQENGGPPYPAYAVSEPFVVSSTGC